MAVMQRPQKPCIETSSFHGDIAAELESPLREKSVSRLATDANGILRDNGTAVYLFRFFFSTLSRSLRQGNKNI